MAATKEELAEILGEVESDADKQHWFTQSARRDIVQIIEMAAELKMESLRLYEPTPIQEQYHASNVKELLFSKGNQVGGSLAGFAEDARAVTGQDPYNKYPKKNGVCVCLGYGEGHIGRVIHKYLFRFGAFEIIRDDETGEWRTYRPWPHAEMRLGRYGDLERAEEARPAPPLIPKRFMVGEPVWTKKGMHVFSMATLTTGWEIHAFNSQGVSEHAQGFQCNLWHIDEDVATEGWVAEAIGRLSKRKGLLRWTCMPHARTDDIVMMLQRAEEEAKKKQPRTVAIYASIDDNPFLSDETKEENKRIWRSMGEEEYERRVHGKLIIGGLRMYPGFDERLHSAIVPLSAQEEEAERAGRTYRCPVQKLLTANMGQIPDDWTLYWGIDPGHTVAAGVCAARPPETLGDFLVFCDEIYIPQCEGASVFAKEMLRHLDGHPIQEFIFDFHGGKLRSLGSSEVPVEVWEKEFSKAGIVCQARGSRMFPGCDDIALREMKVREGLLIKNKGQHQGYPTLLFMPDKVPNLINEIKGFRKKVVRIKGRDIVTDQGDRRAHTHALEACEYLVAHGCPWVKPAIKVSRLSTVVDRIRAVNSRLRNLASRTEQGTMGGIVLGPRGIPPKK